MALLGASGSGKTTLLNLVSGIDTPDGGHVRLDGADVHALAEPERTLMRRRKIGFVFQFFNLIPTLKVGENVARVAERVLQLSHGQIVRSPQSVKPFTPILLRAGLRYMLRHRWQGLLAITGIALGVAVVSAVDLANSGARAAFELSAQQLQGKTTHRLVVPGATLPDQVYVGLHRQGGAPLMAPVVNGWVGIEGVWVVTN